MSRIALIVLVLFVVLAALLLLLWANQSLIWDERSYRQGVQYIQDLQRQDVETGLDYAPTALVGSCVDYTQSGLFPTAYDAGSFVDGCRIQAGG